MPGCAILKGEGVRVQEPSVEPVGSTAGKWVLVESEMKLLAIGDRTFAGTSLRRSLDAAGRAVFMPAVKSVLDSGQPFVASVLHMDVEYRVEIEPLLSPKSGHIVACLGRYTSAGQNTEDDPKPVIGCWEWDVPPPGTGETIASYWDENLYELYDLKSEIPGSQPGAYATPHWFNSIVAPEDRARLRLLIDDGITVSNDELHTIAYTIITGYGTDQRGRRRLRLSGRASRDHMTGRTCLAGVSHEVPNSFNDVTPGLSTSRTDGFLRATFALAEDSALAAIDTHFWEVYMTSPGWGAASLPRPADGSVAALVHPDDLLMVQGFLLKAAGERAILGALPARVAVEDGPWAMHDIHATGAHIASGGSRYVLARFTKAEEGQDG